ncbi:hypothetical protein OG729_03290 [Streptomyces sp. NBC_00210]|uniref:hypothetical protein n=1 Tax=Streptomyces sp. NBC_00210 TaxID=2903636 RepID=UPI0032513D39
MPNDIEFSDEVRDMLFVLLGDRPLQANSDLAYGSSVPFLDFADRLMDLRDRITDSVSSVQGALPPQVAEQYVQAMSTLTGTNGVDHFEEFIKQLDALSEGQVEQSRKIMESKWEIIAEIIQLLIELAFIAAMAFFTGGLSFGEAALAKSRTRFTLLLILDRLLRSTNLLPAFSEALQEAFTTFAVRLAMLSLNTGNRRPDGIDWGDIGKSAAAGALAGFFIGGLSGAFDKFFKNYFNDFGDNKWAWGGSQMGQEFLSEGIGETGAEFIVNGAFEGKWEWKWDTFLGAGLSAISEFVVMGGVGAGGLFLHNKFFGPQNFSEYNELPDSGGGGGRGPKGSGNATPLPLPANDLVSGGIDYANSGPNSVATPPPPPTPLPPRNAVGHGFGAAAPQALHPLPDSHLPAPGPLPGADVDSTNGAAGSAAHPDPVGNPPLSPSANRSIPPSGSAGSAGSATEGSATGGERGGSAPLFPGAVTPTGVHPPPAGSTLPTPIGSQTPSPGPAAQTTPPITSPTPSSTRPISPGPSPTPSPVTMPDTSTAPSSTEGDEPSHSPENLSLPPTTTPLNSASPAGGTSTPGTSLPASAPASTPSSSTPAGSSTSPPDGPSAGQPVPEELPDETPRDIETHTPDRRVGPATTPAHTSADPIRPRTESGPESVQQPAPDKQTQPAMVDPVPDPVRPEQWRPRRLDAPASPLWTERYDPAADPLGPDRTSQTLAGHDTVIRTWIRRIEADDGRWVRNLTLELPVRFGDGFHADRLPQFEHHMRGLLDEHLNHGLVLPRSGDQLHIDVNLVHAPDHPEAIELSATDKPADSDQFHFRMFSDDPDLAPSEYDRRRRRNDATALHELMHYTGLKDRMQDGSSLFRRIAGGQVHPVGIMADLDTLPGPAVPLDYVQTIEDVTDSGPVLRDHPRSAPAPAPVVTSSADPASLLPPTDRFPAHPPSQGKGRDSDSTVSESAPHENTHQRQPHDPAPVVPQTVAAATPVRPADLERLRYQHEAEAYERRLGDYLSEHPKVVEQVAKFARILWEKTPPALRGGLGTYQNVVPGAVGTDPQLLEQVAHHGNFREQSTLLWNALRYNVFGMLLGRAVSQPAAITEERRWRGDPSDGPFSRRAPHELRPPLSTAERAFSSDGATWKPGEEQSGIDHRPPRPVAGDTRPLTLEDSPHAAAQRTGGLVLTGTSGTAYNLLDAAEAANERWDAGLDLRWMRLAAVGTMLSNRHHTLHELLAAAELWANVNAHPDRRDLGFDYDDNWGRYARLSPLSEQELREHVAVDGRFPDERVREFYADAGSGATPGSAAPRLSRLLPEGSWWRLFIDPNVHADAFRRTPEDVGGHLDVGTYPGYRQSMTAAYREVLDGGRIGRDWSRIDADAYEELHNMATRYLVPEAGQNTVTTWSGHEGGRTTMRGTGADRVAPDIKDDLLLGRRLLFAVDEPRQPGMPKPLVVFHHGQHGGQVSIDYTPGEAREVVQAAMDRYYDEVAVAAGTDEKLRAIARVTRALQILQPFTDANSRVNVHLLMQKFLLEQGFRPAVLMDSRSLFLGGFTVEEIVGGLKEGMARFDRHVQWARWDGFNQPEGPPDTDQVDQLAAVLGLTGGLPDERRLQVTDTVRTARALFGSELPGSDEQDAARLAATRSLSGPAGARFPHRTTPLAIIEYTREVFGLDSTDDVSHADIGALADAAIQASALGRPLDIDVLRSLTQPPPANESGPDAASDRSSSVSPGVEPAWEALAYDPPSDGIKPLVFLVSELTANVPVRDADELGMALLPAVQGEPMGSVRFVLRAAARSFSSDPVETVSELAESLGAPVDLLLADADGAVRLLRFDDGGGHENLGPVAEANGPRGNPGGLPGGTPLWSDLTQGSADSDATAAETAEFGGGTPAPVNRPPTAQDSGFLLTTDGRQLPVDQVSTRTIVGKDGTDGIGRAAHTEADMAHRDQSFPHLPAVTQFVDFDPATGTESALQPLPFGGEAYFWASHGSRHGVQLPMNDGRIEEVRGVGPLLRRRPSLSRLEPHVPVVMLVCEGAELPADSDDFLTDISPAQDAANSTGRDTWTGTARFGLFGPTGDRPARLFKVDDLASPRERWLRFRPEPAPAELDALLAESGLDPSATELRTRALRWDRVLRHAFGPDVGSSPHYGALVQALASLENERLADPDRPHGPLTLALLEQTIQHWYAGQDGAAPHSSGIDAQVRTLLGRLAGLPETSSLLSAPVTASPRTAAPGSADSSAGPHPALGSALSSFLQSSEASKKPIERQLELRRPPRIDGELPPPALRPRTVHYSDKSRMPALGDSVHSLIPNLADDVASRSTGFGLKDFTLRGTDLALSEIARKLDEAPALGPKAPGGKSPSGTGLLADVATALSDDLDGLVGDGRDFPYTDTKGHPRVLKLRLRPYGQWEKFSDVGEGGPTALGKVWQTALTTGQTPKVNTSRMFNPMVPLFPVTKPAHVFARLGLRFGQGRSLGYTLTSQVTAQVESKVSGASHVHLDDMYYDFSVTDADGIPLTPDGSANGRPRLTGFAVRSGLALRLPDAATAENKPGRIPRTLEFRSQPDLRLVGTENYGPVAHIRDWAAGQIGAKPGSSAYGELDAFFSARNFQRVAPLMATGRITTPALYGDGKNARPLGVFTVRATSQRALLLTDSVVHALRSQAQLTQADSRSLTKSNTQEISPTVGPLLQWMGLNDARLNLRLLIGITGRFGHTSSRSSATGGSGSVQATGVTGDKAATGLYLVQKTIRVQRTGRDRGAPAQQNGDKPQYGAQEFTTWSLERIPGSEARRLAGWDDGTAMRSRGGLPAPFPPPYLTVDRPPTLGVGRVELFTFSDGQFTHDGPDGPDSSTLLDHFTDRVLTEASRAYPDLVAPFSELDPANPRWRNADHFQLALSNALEVSRTLAQTSMAENLEALTTTGLRIDLREHGRLHRGYRYIWLDGELTGRRYEGTDISRKIEFSAAGGEKLDSELGVSHSAEGGIQALITLRGTKTNEIGVSKHAGTLTLGGTGGGQRDESSAFGPSVARDIETDSTTPPHLFSYQLSVTAGRGGYWRLPALLRGAISAGLLGTQAFVFREGHRPLIGGPTGAGAGGALTGRVLLSVPAEHSSEADPDLPDADHPYRDLTGTVRDRPMHDSDAFQLATGSPAQMRAVAGRIAAPYENHPFQTLIVLGRPELIAAAEAVLKRASGGSWHQTQQGAPGHDAALTVFQSPYLTANSDQSMGPSGYRVSGLWAPGPYLNRSGVLAHRMVLRGLQILAGPAPIAVGHTLTGGTQTAGKNTKSLTFSFGGSFVAVNTHAVGNGGVFGIGPTFMPWTYNRAISETLTLSASADVIRSDSGHQVLVSGNADHEVAAASTALGTMSATNSPLVPRALGGAAGRKVLVPGGWIGHLPEKSALELGLIQDGFGPVPRYANHIWTPQGWLPTGRFGSYPVNALNTAAVLADFDRQLSRLFARDSDRDTVRRLVSGRVVRALRGEMSGAGASVPTRIGRWGWDVVRVGGRQVRVRAELLPGESRFVGIDHSAEFKDSLSATESKSSGISRTRGPQLGLMTSQFGQTGNPAAPLVGPTYSETGSSLVTRSANRSEAAREAWSVKLTDPYAEHVTPYRLRLTLEVEGARDDEPDGNAPAPAGGRSRGPIAAAFRGKQRVVEEDGVGELRTHTSLSLTLPAQGAPTLLDTPLTPPAPGPVRPAPLPAFTGDANWRSVRHPDGSVKPFVLPEDGFVIRDVSGSAQVRDAAQRALAKAYNIRFRDTDTAQTAPKWRGDTPLTRIGTGSAHNLEEGTTGTVLSSFAGKALGRGGHAVPGLIEDSVVGGADGQLTVYCKPHLDRAQLLTVADGVKMEHSRRGTTEGAQSVSGSESASISVGEVTVVPAGRAGTAAPGPTVPGPNAAGSDTLPGGLASSENTKLEVKGRAFLFSVPASWLTVASVHRHFKDGRIGRALISPFQALAPAHFGNAGQQAYETDAAVLAWVAEDVARELGLIDDAVFPERAGKAWDAVRAVSKAWVEADKAYWLARREAGTTPYAEFTAAQGQFETAETEHELARAEYDTAHEPLVAASTTAEALRSRATTLREQAQTALRQAEAEAERIDAEAREGVAAGPDPDTGPAALEALAGLDEARDRFDRDGTRAGQLDDEADRIVAAAREQTAQRRADAVARRDTARTQLDAAAGELHRAQTVYEGHQQELASLLATAEQLAGRYHEVRSAADRLTRWHVLRATAEGRATLGDLAEPPEVTFTDPQAAPEAPTYKKETGENGITTLTSPTGERHSLLDVPEDGESFFHALAEGLRHDSPGAATALAGPPSALRTLFAGRLRDPANADLLDSVAPDERDTFSPAELAQASVDLADGTPERREFDAIGVVPHSTDLSADSRLDLATAQLLRPGAAADDTGWDHGAADLLPALAARTFGVPVTVVDDAGRFQTFLPATDTGAPPVVLYLADRHFQAAVRGLVRGGAANASARPAATPAGPVRPAHATPPWQPPSDAQNTPRFDAASDHLRLTGPDGAVYDLVEARGDGNRFYTALAAALPAGPAAPGRPRPRAADAIATAVAASALPSNARLDPGAVFRAGDPGVTDAGLSAATLGTLHGNGGTLPPGTALDEQQTAALIRSQLRSGRRWDPATAALAAQLAAGALGVRVTLVHEDGSFDSRPAATGPDDLTEVMLYERGGTYLTVLARAAEQTTPAQPQDEAPQDPAPQDPAPQDPAPQDPAPQDPAPQDPAPQDPAPQAPEPTGVQSPTLTLQSGTAGPTTGPSPVVHMQSDADVLLTRDGRRVPVDQIRTQPVTGPGGNGHVGRSAHTDADMARRQHTFPHLSGVQHFVSVDPVTGAEGELERLPFAGEAYHWFSHGSRSGVEVPLQDGSTASVRGVGPLLRRRPSLSRLAPAVPVVMVMCEGAALPEGTDDFLTGISPAQETANETRRITWASTGRIGALEPDGDRPARLFTVDGPDAARRLWVKHRPEPTGSELDALLAESGLDPAADQPRTRALRWIRALRHVFGPDIDLDPRHLELIRSLAARENARLADPSQPHGPLTRDLLESTGLPATAGDDDRDAPPRPRRVPGAALSAFLQAPEESPDTSDDEDAGPHSPPVEEAAFGALDPEQDATELYDLYDQYAEDSEDFEDTHAYEYSDDEPPFNLQPASPAPTPPSQDRIARPLLTRDYTFLSLGSPGPLFSRLTNMKLRFFPYGPADNARAYGLTLPTQGIAEVFGADHPELQVSEDLSLAVDHRQLSQQVYATEKAFKAAVVKLRAAGRGVSLAQDFDMSIVLRAPDGTDMTLYQVTPVFLTRSGRSEEEVCRDFCQMVAGGYPLSHVVFRSPDRKLTAISRANASSGWEETGTHQLAQALAEIADGTRPLDDIGPAWAAHRIREDDRAIGGVDGPLPGEAYGSALSLTEPDNSRRDRLSHAAHQSGFNEWAWADVGESYVVQSINAVDEEGNPSLARNYAKPADDRGSYYGYHFAAVVLASEDGRSQITLENHSRVNLTREAIRRTVRRNLTACSMEQLLATEAALRQQLEEYAPQDRTSPEAATVEARLALATALVAAQRAAENCFGLAQGTPGLAAARAEEEQALIRAAYRVRKASPLLDGSDQWYLRMAGKRPGESFHDLNAQLLSSESSAEANPLTLVVLHGHKLPRQETVSFAAGDRTVEREQMFKVRSLADTMARVGIWNAGQGLPMPGLTITGQDRRQRRPSLMGRRPELLGREQAEAVRKAVRDRMRETLSSHLGSAEPLLTDRPKVTVEQFLIEAKSVTGLPGDPGTERRTTIEVTDPRDFPASPRPAAPAAADSAVPAPPAPDTLPHRLTEVAGSGDRFTEALTYALRENAPQLFDSGSALASAMSRSGLAADASTALRHWVSTHITAADVPADIPLLDPRTKLSLRELDAIGVRLPTIQRTQAVLMGGSLTVAEAGLDRGDTFRLLLSRRADSSEAVRSVVATLVADELGIRLAVVRRTVDGGERIDYFGPLRGVPILLCTTDDGPFFAALWTPPLPPLPPSG